MISDVECARTSCLYHSILQSLITSCDAPFHDRNLSLTRLQFANGGGSNGFISMDCADSRSLADFWVAMLGGEVRFTNGGNVVVRTDWVWLCIDARRRLRGAHVPDGACPNRFISISPPTTSRHPWASHPARGSRGVRATGTDEWRVSWTRRSSVLFTTQVRPEAL